MKRNIASLFTLLLCLSSWGNVPSGYYNNAIGKSDEALMTALDGIILPHTELSYDYLWSAYDDTDMGSDGYYIDMYSTCKYNRSSYHVSTASYVGQGLNREHSFPKSWFGGEEYPMYTDLTMIIPTDGFVNQRRSNHPYGVCAGGTTYVNEELNVTMKGKLGKSTYNGYAETVFEPDDEYKGDFARIYFYMVTCYKSKIQSWPGCDQLDYVTNHYKAFSNWSMQMLMEWHRADPVSQKEIDRNNAVYLHQGNRNPYVDHPELAEHIWGTKQSTAWTGHGSDDDLVKKDPVMLEVDQEKITDTSFCANWTDGGDVSSYTLQVNRIAVPSDETATLLMTENFSKVVAYSDGYNDIAGSLDQYTDNEGWSGYKVYTAANHGLKIGTATAIGYVISPNLSLSSTVTVVLNAKNWISSSGKSDASTISVSCGNVSQTVTLNDNATDHTVVLHGCEADNIKISMTAAGKRFYLYNVSIYNGDLTAKYNAPRRVIVEEGDSTWRMVSGITDTCYTVKGLAGGIYEYLVKAIYTDGSESVWSNIQNVTLKGGTEELLVGDVNHDGEVNISDVTSIIDYLLGTSSDNFDKEAADVNHDGEINISDVTTLVDMLLGKR